MSMYTRTHAHHSPTPISIGGRPGFGIMYRSLLSGFLFSGLLALGGCADALSGEEFVEREAALSSAHSLEHPVAAGVFHPHLVDTSALVLRHADAEVSQIEQHIILVGRDASESGTHSPSLPEAGTLRILAHIERFEGESDGYSMTLEKDDTPTPPSAFQPINDGIDGITPIPDPFDRGPSNPLGREDDTEETQTHALISSTSSPLTLESISLGGMNNLLIIDAQIYDALDRGERVLVVSGD